MIALAGGSGRCLLLLGAFTAVTRVELLKDVVWNTFEHLTWKCSKQLPADVQGIGDRSILVGS
jgi:hypothetical protein